MSEEVNAYAIGETSGGEVVLAFLSDTTIKNATTLPPDRAREVAAELRRFADRIDDGQDGGSA